MQNFYYTERCSRRRKQLLLVITDHYLDDNDPEEMVHHGIYLLLGQDVNTLLQNTELREKHLSNWKTVRKYRESPKLIQPYFTTAIAVRLCDKCFSGASAIRRIK
ncbi:hypothetical protein AVEN_201982-1 [Araneus ventricosus]|uniref:Uncharacterized protein n=1 Tax=Araneus ventricosus TaxID=182803 RepID=A0A4Y2KWC0_ARAVE|nr:hypothetical protein AVEN_201982-1 [Araneus ventricosus]